MYKMALPLFLIALAGTLGGLATVCRPQSLAAAEPPPDTRPAAFPRTRDPLPSDADPLPPPPARPPSPGDLRQAAFEGGERAVERALLPLVKAISTVADEVSEINRKVKELEGTGLARQEKTAKELSALGGDITRLSKQLKDVQAELKAVGEYQSRSAFRGSGETDPEVSQLRAENEKLKAKVDALAETLKKVQEGRPPPKPEPPPIQWKRIEARLPCGFSTIVDVGPEGRVVICPNCKTSALFR